MPGLKIAILGTRGIPNNYGGFEQITTYLAEGLVNRGHEVTVYNSHNHPCQEQVFKGVRIVHCYDPEFSMGTAGQFVYDFNCIVNARRKNFDVLLFMGYTSSSVWGPLFPSKPVVISNMDGFEWKRSKYSKPVQRFLRHAESLAVRHSDYHIADSRIIASYLDEHYKIQSKYIPYGSQVNLEADENLLNELSLEEGNYFLLIARMVPENNIEMILEGFNQTSSSQPFVVVGNIANKFGQYLKEKFASGRIRFLGCLFDQDKLHTLRKYCSMYFHGHSVGGTNPSLLDAMSSRALIAAHQNDFNRCILGDDAFYFSNAEEVRNIIHMPETPCSGIMIQRNYSKVEREYNWEKIVSEYEDYIISCHNQKCR